MRSVLLAAGVYNLLWGTIAVAAPNAMFHWVGATLPNYPQLWQGIGMIVGVYGVGYAIPTFDPLRHWPVILVGFLGKVFGPIGFLQAILQGVWPWKMLWINVFNDLIWIVPFALILRAAYTQGRRT